MGRVCPEGIPLESERQGPGHDLVFPIFSVPFTNYLSFLQADTCGIEDPVGG